MEKYICNDSTTFTFVLPTFFVTFTFVEKLWDFLTKVLHTLFVSKNLSNKIKDLQFVYIEKLI